MRVCVYPGSFDPITLAHADIIKRACGIFDFCHIGVLQNERKTPVFTESERIEMINEVLLDMNIKNADVTTFSGLLVDFAESVGACATVRGVRDIDDYVQENRMFALNCALNGNIETVILMSRPELSMISSSAVREIAGFGGDTDMLVPRCIKEKVKKIGAK